MDTAAMQQFLAACPILTHRWVATADFRGFPWY